MIKRKNILICGATGFIGRNLTEYFSRFKDCRVYAVWFKEPVPKALRRHPNIQWLRADLRREQDARRVLKGMDILLQAAATTSGAKDILSRPHYHVTDNAVMNSLLFRACHEAGVKQVVFFSCTVMYPQKSRPVQENDFNGNITGHYFGVGWTKVYLEKMCEFYSRIGNTKYTVIRHSNIYGPWDKYDLERSHVFGATIAKVMAAPAGGRVRVWGKGLEERDLLHVEDLMRFVRAALNRQKTKFECVNVGLGRSVTVRELVQKIVRASGRKQTLEYDTSKPVVGFKLKLNIQKARRVYGWKPAVSLDEGIRKTLRWYRNFFAAGKAE